MLLLQSEPVTIGNPLKHVIKKVESVYLPVPSSGRPLLREVLDPPLGKCELITSNNRKKGVNIVALVSRF